MSHFRLYRMLHYRSLSALVLIPLVMGLTFLGGWWFLALVAVVLMLASYEYVQIAQRGGAQANIVCIVGFIWLALLLAHYQALDLLLPGTIAFVFIGLTWALIRFERGVPTTVMDWALTTAGGLYLGVTSAQFVLLRGMRANVGGQMVDVGLGMTVLGLLGSWAVDTGAYVVGSLWGRRRMSPRLSPNKTWEGYAGGLLGGVLFGGVWPWLAGMLSFNQLPGLNIWHSLMMCTLVAILTPLGDLGESMLKRWAEVKDSGSLIPGHGGVLDRLDTLLWATVIFYYYAQWVV